MDQQTFIRLMKQPGLLRRDSLHDLQSVSDEFPYCQSAQILYFLSLLKDKNIHFHGRLKLAAAYAADRSLLKDHVDTLLNPESKSIPAKPAEAYVPAESTDPKEELQENDPVTEEGTKAEADQKTENVDERNLQELRSDREADMVGVTREPEDAPHAESAYEPEEITDPDRVSEEKHLEEESVEEQHMTDPETASESRPGLEDVPDDDDDQPEAASEETKSKQELIDQFIENAPRITRSRSDFFNPVDYARSSAVDKDDIVSETLATIHYRQGHYAKAIKIYEKLSLKNPEKSTYFAGLIEKIKSEQNINT